MSNMSNLLKSDISEQQNTKLNSINEMQKNTLIRNNSAEIPFYKTEKVELWLIIELVNKNTFLAEIDIRGEISDDIKASIKPIYFNHSPRELNIDTINKLALNCEKITENGTKIKIYLACAFLIIAEYYNEIFLKEDRFEFLYGTNTKKMAQKIFKADPMAFFMEVLDQVHQGDETEKELMILAEFTAHINNANTVPIFIKGSPGAGKSSLNNAISKITPPRFVLAISSLSSKSLFYNMNTMNQNYIKLVCNDFFDSEVVSFVKDWADTTEEPTLKHMTVINGEGVTLEIEGKRGLSVTSADSMSNQQVNRRMYHLNPQENEDHLKLTQEFIIKKSIENNDSVLENAIETANAVYDLIADGEFTVFNPWLEQIDFSKYSPTRLKHIIHMIMARTLIYRHKREEIIEGVLLGTKEDVKRVLELDNQLNYLQTSQLPRKAFDIVYDLPLWNPDLNAEANMIFGTTFANLVEKTGISRGTLRRWIFGEGDILGLHAMGIVKSIKKDPDNDKSPWFLFRVDSGMEDVLDVQSKNGALEGKEINAEATLRHFIACSPDKMIRENVLQEKINGFSNLKTDKDVAEFLKMAEKEILVDNNENGRLINPIAENFINEFGSADHSTSNEHDEKTGTLHENGIKSIKSTRSVNGEPEQDEIKHSDNKLLNLENKIQNIDFDEMSTEQLEGLVNKYPEARNELKRRYGVKT